jgi:hypothetical protein
MGAVDSQIFYVVHTRPRLDHLSQQYQIQFNSCLKFVHFCNNLYCRHKEDHWNYSIHL